MLERFKIRSIFEEIRRNSHISYDLMANTCTALHEYYEHRTNIIDSCEYVFCGRLENLQKVS